MKIYSLNVCPGCSGCQHLKWLLSARVLAVEMTLKIQNMLVEIQTNFYFQAIPN